jgi:hypothetical protein
MDNSSRIALISEQLIELKQLVQKFQESPQQVFLIEVDLALEKLRRMYEGLNRLDIQSLDSLQGEKDMLKVQNEIIEKKSIPETREEISPKKEPGGGAIIFPESVEEKKELPGETQTKEAQPVLIDLFSTTSSQEQPNIKRTIVEKMADEKPVEIVADKIGKKKISGLSQAIGINEKFYFINELFEGNMKEYKNAIDALDRAENLAGAVDYLGSLAEKNTWDKSKEAYNMILEFVERKFS